MSEALLEFLQALALDFYGRLRPWNSENLVLYMLRRPEQFLIPGSF